jgi:hypothetical protein
MVLDLIVDDGVPGRGHRSCLLDPGFDLAGAADAAHPVFGRAVAIELALRWAPSPAGAFPPAAGSVRRAAVALAGGTAQLKNLAAQTASSIDWHGDLHVLSDAVHSQIEAIKAGH